MPQHMKYHPFIRDDRAIRMQTKQTKIYQGNGNEKSSLLQGLYHTTDQVYRVKVCINLNEYGYKSLTLAGSGDI